MRQLCVHRDMNHFGKFEEHSRTWLELLSATPRATLTHPLSYSPNFPRALYLDEHTLTHVNSRHIKVDHN